MSWMDFGDVRKGRGLRVKNMQKVSGDQAANDAARGIRSDKPRRKIKGLKGQARNPLPAADIRKLEGIARQREKGRKITEADKAYLRKMGFPVHKDM